MARGSDPSGRWLPERMASPSGESSRATSIPSSVANSWFSRIITGALTGVGLISEKKASGRRE
ncbi:MAG: hypothetical protein CM1200mP2_37580 [Planctomycetaceae bacterium]|nr:MAG: hypothetical protein CM1200mP2_37580 [Planctomycetaceae bacterium]